MHSLKLLVIPHRSKMKQIDILGVPFPSPISFLTAMISENTVSEIGIGSFAGSPTITHNTVYGGPYVNTLIVVQGKSPFNCSQ